MRLAPRACSVLVLPLALGACAARHDGADAAPGADARDGGGGSDAPDAMARPDVPAAPDAPAAFDVVAPSDAPIAADAPAACPADVGRDWSCEAAGAARVRCHAGALERVACDYGCTAATPATVDATCDCGPHGAAHIWTCESDRDIHVCAAGYWYTRSCDGRGCESLPVNVPDDCVAAPPSALQPVLDRLGGSCATLSPGTHCGLSVRDLASGASASWHGDDWFVSASSAKALWVAAALYDVGVAPVEPYHMPIFADSDNYASGSVIDLLASPARINTFMQEQAGMSLSGFCDWSFGHGRHASNCPSTAGGDNFFTANDGVGFLARLWGRTLLADDATDAELAWMLLSPRSGYGGWIGTQLPASVRPRVHHKAGWLPPDAVPGYSNSNELGIVEIDAHHAYAVALLMNGGADYDGHQLPMLEYASCVIFHAVAADAGDPFAACTPP